jgi:hypothetical protein
MASQNLDDDLRSLTVDVMQLHPELSEMVRLGYTKDSFYENEGEWTKCGQIIARDGCF